MNCLYTKFHYLFLVGMFKSAAYKKWEKAAIAGVSLVADAAEHLERTATDKGIEHEHSMAGGVDHQFMFQNKFEIMLFKFP